MRIEITGTPDERQTKLENEVYPNTDRSIPSQPGLLLGVSKKEGNMKRVLLYHHRHNLAIPVKKKLIARCLGVTKGPQGLLFM